MADSGDLGLIVALARGEQAALGSLYDRYSPVMLGLGLKILRSRDDAEEVLHDVFVEVWKAAGDFDPGRGSVRRWLLLRMRSRCLDRLKSARHTRTVLAGHDLEQFAGGVEGAQVGDAARVANAVSELPESQRRILELGFFQGYSHSDIARELGVPVGTVKSRVHAAMKLLRDRFRASPSMIDVHK